jgi:hypothetical protein
MIKSFYLIAFVFFSLSAFAGPFDLYENKIYEDNIKTVTLHPNGYPFATPIIQLHAQNELIFSFDELTDVVSDFRYTIVQCDHEWRATNTSVFEYIDGFSEGFLSDYDLSFNTTAEYVHFKLPIPNADFNFKQSGNYAIVIYRDSEDEPSIVHRFMVADPRVSVENAGIVLTSSVNLRDKYQEIIFDLNHKGFVLNNPHQEIKVMVTQNDRWDNAITGIKPLFIGENILRFNYNMKIAFNSMKEYRELDIRSLRYRTQGVRAIDVLESGNVVYLMPDQSRQLEDYRYEGNGDLNGKFLIAVQEGRSDDLESDYTDVNFFFDFETPISNGSFYVVGQFNNYEITEQNRMVFNENNLGYEATILFKQGFYNYMYVFVPDNQPTLKDHSFTEGDFYDTENDYAIYIYYRPFGQRYDQLIGYTLINSRLNRF